MKKLIISIFILSSFSLFAQDSTRVEKDSINVTSKKLKFSIFGGAGLILDEADFGEYFETTPIYFLGLEYPITDSKNWTLQLKAHYWQATSTKEYTKGTYYKLSNNKYAQLALACYIKWFYLNIGDFRSSFQLGYYSPLINPGTYTGLDLGMGVDYKVSSNYTISLLLNVADYKGEHISGTWTLFYHLYTAVSINLYYRINLGL